MTRRRSLTVQMLALALLVALACAGSPARAQTAARRDVPAGEVTGLEMGIEGALRAVPGGRLVWLVTVHEVVRRRDLRPAPDTALSVTASFDPGRVLATARTDAAGRAELAIVLPEDLEIAPTLMVEAISPRAIRRTFDAAIELAPRERIELVVDRDHAPPAGSILAVGRVRDARDGSPRADVEVRLALQGLRGAVRAPDVLRTDARGVFWAVVPIPDREGPLHLVATSEHAAPFSIGLEIARDVLPALWARATPARPLARPGDAIDVDVQVRTGEGEPIAHARVDWADAPRRDDEDPIRTDAGGHATLRWEIDRRSIGADWEDRAREVRVIDPAHGTGSATARLRVARRATFTTWSVEGGALVPGLPARVFVRVTEADGGVRAGADVGLESARLAAAGSARTDGDGVAAFDVTLAAATATDDCGGPAAVAATIVVGGAREPVCLPIDPDATLAVRARAAGASVEVEVRRRADVARSPVVVTALVAREGGWTPIARAVLAPTATTASIALGVRAPTEVWIRARPVLGAGQEVRGGGALLWMGGAPRLELRADEAGAATVSAGARTDALTEAIVAVDPARALALRALLRGALGPLGAAVAEGRGPIYLDALAASEVPRDDAASAVLREGAIEPVPLPDDAVALGLLRDPWRTRARFVRGRLGALMRAVEDYVDAHVPDGLESVAVRERGTWRFDREILEAALAESGLGDERVAALDGEPLDIDALTTLDPAFTYDHVAHRITRERLFRVLGQLRDLVRDRELDLPWARRGDPRLYPVSLLEAEVAWRGDYPERAHLFDAWGQPFALVPVRGRARFEFLQPVSGYELVSAGPDGRIGTRDDVVDPFARVLESGGVYAEAVGEDELIARLRSVSLGRATVEALAGLFAVESSPWEIETAAAPSSPWEAAPPAIDALPLPPAPVPALASALGTVRAIEPGAGADVTWSLPRERRPYVALALAFAADGGVAIGARPFEAGAPVAARFDPPDVMRPGEALRVPLAIVRLAPGPDARASVRASSDAVAARIEGDAVVLEARRVGVAELALAVEGEGTATWSSAHRVRVLPAGSLRATHSGALAAPDARFDLALASDGRAWRARLVVGAPQALRRDPLFDEGPRSAVVAWAAAVGGAPPSDDDLALLDRAPSDAPGLATACALVAWAARPEPLPAVATTAQRLAGELPADLGARAAILAALAPAAPAVVDERSSDPVVSVIARLRRDGWRALATARDRPSVLARMAAALLLADREDAIGRALFDLARAAAGEDGLDPAAEGAYPGTIALVIAARQLGEDALADALVPAVLRRLYLAPRLGTEASFWALAASSFGALGAAGPSEIEVEIDGARRTVALQGGAVALDVRPGASVRVHAASPVWARIESRTVRPLAARDEAGLALRVEGAAGRAGEHAALEVVIESQRDAGLPAAVIEIALPSAAVLDEHARDALSACSAVVRVDEPDGAGVVRVHLAALAARGTHRLPLAVRWRASGETHGLALVAYDAAQPWAQTILPERAITVEAP